MSGEPMTLPPACRWPECLYCEKPVTETQQAIGAYELIPTAGLVHRKCLKAVVTRYAAQMVR